MRQSSLLSSLRRHRHTPPRVCVPVDAARVAPRPWLRKSTPALTPTLESQLGQNLRLPHSPPSTSGHPNSDMSLPGHWQARESFARSPWLHHSPRRTVCIPPLASSPLSPRAIPPTCISSLSLSLPISLPFPSQTQKYLIRLKLGTRVLSLKANICPRICWKSLGCS